MNRILLQSFNRQSITENESSLYKYIYSKMKDVFFVGTVKPDFIKEEHFILSKNISKVSTKKDILVLANFLTKRTKSKDILFINHGLSFKSGFLKSISSFPLCLRPMIWFAMKYNIKKFTKLASYCPVMTDELIRTSKVSEDKILMCGYFRNYKKKEEKHKEVYFPTWREGGVDISIPKRNIAVSKHPRTKQIFKNEVKTNIEEVNTAWMDYSSLIYDCYVNKINYKVWRPDMKRYSKKRGFIDLMDNPSKELKPYNMNDRANKVIVKCLKEFKK